MKTLTRTALLVLMLALAASAGTIYTVGFEDWTGNASDRDFNDTVFQVSGLAFHTTGTWNQPIPTPYPDETPFPYSTASYFDSAFATGDLVSTFLFQQTAYLETAYIRVGTGAWLPITGTLSIAAIAGDLVSFRLQVGDSFLYPRAGDNPDGMTHAIEGGAEAPEPAGVFLIGGGLCLLSLCRRGRHAKIASCNTKDKDV